MNPNPRTKLRLFAGFPSYGGNGGISSEVPDVRDWWTKTILKIQADPRIEAIDPARIANLRDVTMTGKVASVTIGDTPVTMVRNRFVTLARQAGADLLLMIDSDQGMMKYYDQPGHVDIWDAAFNEIYNHYHKGPLCIGAPYCGPPNGTENVYVFQWGNYGVRGDETRFSLDQYTRAEASKMAGIQECAALPTGAILIDLRCFDLIEPSKFTKRQTLERLHTGQITIDEALDGLRDGFFYYEYADQYADQKASTEDVTCTRDISLAGLAKLGYNPLRCAWDSWVGHYKPWNVGKPQMYGADQIAANFAKAVRADSRTDERIVDLSQILPQLPKSMRDKQPIIVGERKAEPKPEPEPEMVPWQDAHTTPKEDVEALTTLVKQVLAEKHECRVLEVGTWLGGTAIPMADAGATVWCIDTWKGTEGDHTGDLAKEAGSPGAIYHEFLKRIGDRYCKSIFPKIATSREAASWGWPNKFDIIFLDADHSYDAVKADIEAWLPHLAEDGIICGHDYNTQGFPGVKKSVLEKFGSHLGLNKLGRSVWAVIPALEAV